MKNLEKLARTFRLPETTTPENLACYWSTTLNFGDKVLLAGYYYRHGENSYFAAVFTHTDSNLSCEGEIRLTAVSEDFFPDNGSAIAWALTH
jgi:hypothetical protein